MGVRSHLLPSRRRSQTVGLGAVAAAAALVTAGCTPGSIGSVPESSGQAESPDTPGTPTDPGTTPIPEPSASCMTTPGFVPLQRLTKREYNEAISTFFGVRGDFSASLPSDSRVSRYDNNSASQQINAALTEGYLAASGSVIEALQANETARARWLTCGEDNEETCAQTIINDLAAVAFRRPVTAAEVDALLAPYRSVQALELGFEAAVAASLRAVLVSPDFLFKTFGADGNTPAVTVEATPSGQVVELNGTEFATRLAGLVWGSVPDEALLAQARAGDFDARHTAETQDRLRTTIQRMLGDERAATMVDVFFHAFLHLEKLAETDRLPDRALFPEWDDALEAAVLTETRTFLTTVITQDESPLTVLTADYSYLNRELAERLYGLPGDGLDDTFQKVQLPPERRGLMTQPSVLTMTSNPNRTSVVNRGLWIMENIMCLPTPTDAPPDAPTETPDIEGASVRERIEAHRADPTCAFCHATMDPLGFGMENFDAIGRFRQLDDDGFAVDSNGELPDGRTFSGAAELVNMVSTSGEFEYCLARNMLEYSVGRRFETREDRCTVQQIADDMQPEDKFSDWILRIAISSPFSYQQLPSEPQ